MVSERSKKRVILQPGHSLMDWIKLGSSNKDLSGTKGKLLTVTAQELAKHNKTNDCWIVIDGKVFNVTEYLNFHPGGVDEMMRGSGKDATELFNNTHSWVNYNSMLKKCLVGHLVSGSSPEKAPKK